ncbi:diuretic hormone receptor-like isoform X2 [Planococcus citri]|uniref:diuretic hormone receptor-like isoform X2 n=1 Tax=Planococcus citri TaxID=170843 RepID=UPI0031F962A2
MESEIMDPELEEELKRENCTRGGLATDKNVPSEYCPRTWDRVMCWPPTAPGTQAIQPCFKEFLGLLYDSSQNATRWCDEFGQWNKTDYTECKELETTDSGPAIIYYTGYTVSLVALSIAVFIFLYYRELRCLRNTIHTNLMCTYILVGFMWILTITLQVMFQGHVSMCIVLIILLNYATLTNFFWMFVEGLYLYMLVVRTFSTENIKLRAYLLIGWGIPVPIITVWSIAKPFETLDVEGSNKAMAEHCPWMIPSIADWIFKFPALCILSLNSIFLIRIMWVLIIKLRSTNSAETQQYRKAMKALVVLIPLLGITYMLTIALPTQGVVATFLQFIRDVLLSTQGFMVAIFYCFLNTEVRNAIRHRAEVWRENREIHSERRRYPSSKESPFVGSENAENMRLFGNHDGSCRAHYLKRESGASDMTTVTYIGCSASTSGRCRSLSGSTACATTMAIRPDQE